MSQQVQELIDKIKSEGIQEAEQKAGDIESVARKKAEEIVEEAQKRAAHLIAEAKAENQKIEEATHQTLSQASRDMLLKLRKEIERILQKIIFSEVNQALTPEHLAEFIKETITIYLGQDADVKDITVTLKERDLKEFKKGFLTKLKDKIKQPITFRSADNISSGFTISFDEGKSSFDFTDASLVGYLSDHVNEEVSKLLKESSK